MFYRKIYHEIVLRTILEKIIQDIKYLIVIFSQEPSQLS